MIPRKFLLTTQQTTYRFGTLGNSGDKSAKEHRFPSGKGRKKPFSAESAIINAFGSKMPGVRVTSLRPSNDDPGCMIRMGDALGFIIAIESGL